MVTKKGLEQRFGVVKPQNTKRNKVIRKAVKKAVKDYKKTFELLAAK